jgi:photosystem II stability/assembly factor-like uncharacterized protein
MKINYILFCLIVINMSIHAQKTIEKAVLINTTQNHTLINIDGKSDDISNKKNEIDEGKHEARFSHYDLSSKTDGIISLNFSVENNKTYIVRETGMNYIDTINRLIVINENSFLEIIEKKTKQKVSEIYDSSKQLMPDLNYSENFARFYFGDEPNPDKYFGIQTAIDYPKVLSVKGRSFDGYNLSYVYYYDSYTSNNQYYKNIFLKPGYYTIRYKFMQSSSEMEYSYIIKAEPSQSVINTTNGSVLSNKKAITLKSANLSDIYFLEDGIHGWIVGEDGIILTTKNGGISWNYLNIKDYRKGSFFTEASKLHGYSNLATNFTKVVFIDSLNGWIGGDNGLLLHTTDGGVNWAANYFISKKNIQDIRLLDDNRMFVNASDMNGTFIAYSENGGNSWSDYFHDYAFLWNYSIFDSINLWKVKSNSVSISRNGGVTWEMKKENKDISHFFFGNDNYFYLDPNNLWLIGFDTLFHTDTSGNQWKQNHLPLPGGKVFFSDSENGYLISKTNKVFRTDNSGNSWKKLEIGTIENLNDIHVVGKSGWLVGDNGTILSTTDQGFTWKYSNLLDFVNQ